MTLTSACGSCVLGEVLLLEKKLSGAKVTGLLGCWGKGTLKSAMSLYCNPKSDNCFQDIQEACPQTGVDCFKCIKRHNALYPATSACWKKHEYDACFPKTSCDSDVQKAFGKCVESSFLLRYDQRYCNQCLQKELKKVYAGLPTRACWGESIAKVCTPNTQKRCNEFFNYVCPPKRASACADCLQDQITNLEKSACPINTRTHCHAKATARMAGQQPKVGLIDHALGLPSWMHPPLPAPTPRPTPRPTMMSTPSSHVPVHVQAKGGAMAVKRALQKNAIHGSHQKKKASNSDDDDDDDDASSR
jgi:hypothetical protein